MYKFYLINLKYVDFNFCYPVNVFRVCCGENFSVFGSDNGLVLTCGDGSNGCLGHGDWASIPKPRLIEALLRLKIVHCEIKIFQSQIIQVCFKLIK